MNVKPAPASGRSSPASFAIIGAGAVGSVLGWHLARAGVRVSMVGRGAHLQQIQTAGLALETAGASATALQMAATSDARTLPVQDVVFLCTKAHDLASAVETARPLIGSHTAIIPAINGLPWWYFKGLPGRHAGPISAVDPDSSLWAEFEAGRIIGAVVHFGASVAAPGLVRRTPGPRLILGELDGQASERVRHVAALLAEGGLATEIDPHIRDAVWSKLLGNIATNPLSVLCGATLDRMFGEPALLAIVRTQMTEALAVGAACGVRFEQDVDERIDIGRKLGAFRTSMLQDFDAGRPLELAAIADAVLELAERFGIPMPVTRTIVELAREADFNSIRRRSPKP